MIDEVSELVRANAMSEKRVSEAVARERFSAAFADRPRRSLAAEVRAQLPEIERRLADGYGYDAVVAAFAEIGIETDVATLHTYVYRARRAIKPSASSGQAVAVPSAPALAPAPASPPVGEGKPPMTFEEAMDRSKWSERYDKLLAPKSLVSRERKRQSGG